VLCDCWQTNPKQTAVLLDLHTWDSLHHLLEELAEDEHLGQLMLEVETGRVTFIPDPVARIEDNDLPNSHPPAVSGA